MKQYNFLKHFENRKFLDVIAAGLLLFSCSHLIWRLCDYTGCFTEVEVFANWLPSVMLHGKAFSLNDFSQAIDAWGMDGDSRPRFLSYYLSALILKFRIALWDWLPPHPSFSPLWPLTLVLSPWLLYRFLRGEIECRCSAMIGTALYMLSAGYLSAATMLFHPGKPLTNLIVIATFYVAMISRKSLPVDVCAPTKVMPLITILYYLLPLPLFLLSDETALYCLLILPVWAHRFFVPRCFKINYLRPCLFNVLVLVFPGVCYLIITFVAAPLLCNTYLQRVYSFNDYLNRYLDLGKAGLTALVGHFTTLAAATFAPWTLLNVSLPIGDLSPSPNSGMFILMLVILCAIFLLIRADATRRCLLTRISILIILFLLFQTFVAAHHPLKLTVTGYYYGAIFSILISILLAVATAAVVHRSRAQTAVAAALIYLAIIQCSNFSRFNESWLAHRNSKGITWLRQAVYNPFIAYADLSQLVPMLNQPVLGYYREDIPVAMRRNRVAWITCFWRERNADYKAALQGHVLALEDLWALVELHYWRIPPKVDHSTTPYTFGPCSINRKSAQAYRVTIDMAQYGQPGEEPVPLLAFANIVTHDRENYGFETKLSYPWFITDLDSLRKYLHNYGYSHILVRDHFPKKRGIYININEILLQELHAGRLERHQIYVRGSAVQSGGTVTLLEFL